MTILGAFAVITALLAVTVGIGFALQRRTARASRTSGSEVIDPTRLGADGLGQHATLLQFSTQMCSRCPGVHRVLHDVADTRTGVRHLDIDLTERPDIARRFHVLQTPTTFILDRDGVVRTRLGGVPSRSVLELELNRLTGV